MKFNQITYPGNTFPRVLRKIIKGGPLYDIYISNPPADSSGFNEDGFDVLAKNDIKIINDLFKGLSAYEEYVSVYLHGSWADGTRNSFSDIDDFVVIDDINIDRKNFINLIKILNKIDLLFCRMDPLQHHGHWITSKTELLDYDNSFIPLSVIAQSKLICGAKRIVARINPEKSRKGLMKNIVSTSNNIKILSCKLFSGCITSFELKCLIGSFALMPAFIFQIQGKIFSKPDAIYRADEIFSRDAQNLIKWSTVCRKNWQVITDSRGFLVFRAFPNLFSNPFLWREFSKHFSPRVNTAQLTKLSDIIICEKSVNKFLREASTYAG